MDREFKKQIHYQAYLNREVQFRHHRYDEELEQYLSVKNGDVQAAEELGRSMFNSGLTGSLSDDPLRDKKYLFVASTTLATRFAIQGGMEEEEAYNTSDFFIKKMDSLQTIQEIIQLQPVMLAAFAEGVQHYQKQRAQQLPIVRCIEYIEDHLQENIRLEDLASAVGYSPKYISHLFSSEMNISMKAFITRKKIEVAQNMLRASQFSILEISDILAFSSQSYFSKVFQKETGLTPKEYQRKFTFSAMGINEN